MPCPTAGQPAQRAARVVPVAVERERHGQGPDMVSALNGIQQAAGFRLQPRTGARVAVEGGEVGLLGVHP
jgi:hypothetical protein